MTDVHPAPVELDRTGATRHAEHTRLHSYGTAAPVDILGVAAHAVTDPDELKRLLSGHQVTKDGRNHWPDFAQVAQTWPLSLWIAVENMFTAGGSRHRRLRRMIAPGFTVHRINRLAGVVDSLVSGLIEDLAADPSDTVDLRARLAEPLPIAVIGHLMGLTPDQITGFKHIVDGVFDTTLKSDEARANNQALEDVLSDLIAAKRAQEEPGDDLTSHLVRVRDNDSDGDGTGLTDEELLGTLVLMISAGYETTVNVIDQAITLLLSHPEQLDLIRAGGPGPTWADVAEETLRLEPAVTHVPLRFAVADIELSDGHRIAKGDAVLASIGAANVHPSWHGDTARRFDVARANKDHLAFGHGIHRCLGAPLARMEITSVLSALFERFPEIRLAVPAQELTPLPSLISNGHTTLPVHLR
ncbi:cytochrome P450 family protein (plasmid) [Streptomyces sp. SDT5-1]|uniref:cytochrome P450 family protein n=1 Tax=Streptomyces sp. SDT5-1 TaxID=3406418 RepID=UPI003FD2D4F1